ncbi:phosphate ABC transporter substrate-binding protein PstS [Mangrovitalea sediminis]|uniref:phosphate ABC transporter substrate-binding protein PstS n=1 Tax=Mangrovitalea sediminis TaxID=1982043 RepID=UPI000BE6060D|nr:phosphate ABC transporter substrate-binding protein PstS [Mangrovitalea sediminis]
MLKKLSCGLVAALTISVSATAAAADVKNISGAGSTFIYPIFAKWADTYHKNTGVKLNYQSIGSGGGIRQIEAKTVDFGASDAPMKPEQLEKQGLIQFPMVMGGVIPCVNLPGIKAGELKLDGTTLADIFMGKIKEWDAKEIQALNPGVKLPHRSITVVHRADGSGTTWIFTNYLTKVSKTWAEKVGNDKAVQWPTGVGAKGNEAVANYVERIKGGIGYVELAYVLQNHMTYVDLKNKAGKYVAPTLDTLQSAAANADWADAKGYYMVLTDQPGDTSWPITGATFVLMHKQPKEAAVSQAAMKFFDWSYRKGAGMAKELQYVPIPMNVVEMIEKSWNQEVKDGGKAVWNGSMAAK